MASTLTGNVTAQTVPPLNGAVNIRTGKTMKGEYMTDDTVYRQAAIDALNLADDKGEIVSLLDVLQIINALPPAQPDAVTASLEELINDYGEDGFFIVDGINYQANELLNELKTNSFVGEKFRKQITKTIVQYFMKFGG